jgi:hypothetical protein
MTPVVLLPLEAPDTPLCTTVQVNVVGATELLKVMPDPEPEQIGLVKDCVTTGMGFTVTVAVCPVVVFEQPMASVTLVSSYVKVPAVPVGTGTVMVFENPPEKTV